VYIVHGTWIPEPHGEYVQAGAFYLWVETDAPSPRAPSRVAGIHPKHLANAAHQTFLAERLGLPRPPAPDGFALTTCSFFFYLLILQLLARVYHQVRASRGLRALGRRSRLPPSRSCHFEIRPAARLVRPAGQARR
jgi:hypothetical protein